MTDGWFAGVDPGDIAAATERLREGRADTPRDWPARAVESGFATDLENYHERLHEATVAAARAAASERERADDRQLVHAVRAMDDTERTANELAERVAEWAESRYDDADAGVAYARELVETDSEDATDRDDADAADSADERLRALAERAVALDEEAESLRAFIERAAPAAAPNLAALAGPVLAARLVSLAGGLESLARKPSGTLQVLGAEDALFAHLEGSAPSPKHGVIYVHEYVHGTRREDRGSAARALAGKLTIAARIDHYAGDRRPSLEDDLEERIARIRAREDDS